MATAAPITGAPTSAPAFRDYNLSALDDFRATLSLIDTLLDVAIDNIDFHKNKASDLIHVAREVWRRADKEAEAIHDALIACKNGERG